MNNIKDHDTIPYRSIKTYVIGFILSMILTIIPFWVVINESVSKVVMLSIVLVTTVIQILIHLICFFHIDPKSNGGWNLIAFTFTMIIVTILVAGSIWIMWNLNCNMMIC